jgi:hypothetical protein
MTLSKDGTLDSSLTFKGFYTNTLEDLKQYFHTFGEMAPKITIGEDGETKARQIITALVRLAYTAREAHFIGYENPDEEAIAGFQAITNGFDALKDAIDNVNLLGGMSHASSIPYVFVVGLLLDMYLYHVDNVFPPKDDIDHYTSFLQIKLTTDAFWYLMFVDSGAIAMLEHSTFAQIGYSLTSPSSAAAFRSDGDAVGSIDPTKL